MIPAQHENPLGTGSAIAGRRTWRDSTDIREPIGLDRLTRRIRNRHVAQLRLLLLVGSAGCHFAGKDA